MLANTIIFIGESINIECAKLLKKLIIIYGGFYL
jgi:hypothetical protein